MPWEAVEYLAGQLGIADASCVKRYPERRSTVYEHAAEIQKRFKYRDFTDRKWGREFRGFLYGRAWTHAEGPVALFNHAVTWLRKNRVLLPGVSVLARQVSEARTVAERRLYEAVARAAFRADTLAAANAALIAAQSRIELAQMWGGGLLASVDGLRFVVPVKSINTGPSPKYYGYKRGVTWLNAVNDQVAGIGAMVVRGTPRDSLYTLDTLLNLDGGVKPEMVATDNASYSDMAFGLYKMLGFRFAPRFRDLEDQRFWRADLPDDGETPAAGYGPLEAVACNKVNLKRIATHWPDMLRVAGSLITNQVRAYDLLQMFGREGHPTPLGATFAEYGRIDKTMHLLALVDPVDDTYRRLMNRQLAVQESRHRLASAICHGSRGPDPTGVP